MNVIVAADKTGESQEQPASGKYSGRYEDVS